MAFLGKGDIKKAEHELNTLKLFTADTTLQHLTIWNINTTADHVTIAYKILSAELAAKQNRMDDAIDLLKEAVAIEDNLNYNAPPPIGFFLSAII